MSLQCAQIQGFRIVANTEEISGCEEDWDTSCRRKDQDSGKSEVCITKKEMKFKVTRILDYSIKSYNFYLRCIVIFNRGAEK